MSRLGRLLGLVLIVSVILCNSGWALTVEEAVSQLKSWEFGGSEEPLNFLRGQVFDSAMDEAAKAQLASQLAAILPDSTYAAQDFICRQLAVIGGEGQVDALLSLVRDAKTANIARYALEQIDSEKVDAGLISVLDSSTGEQKIGIINTLGNRESKTAVPAIAKELNSSDAGVAAAAAQALGRIGTEEAAKVLGEKFKKGKAAFAVVDGYMLAADNLLAEGSNAAAFGVYEDVYKSKAQPLVRAMALKGLSMSGSSEKVLEYAMEGLSSEDKEIQQMAVMLARQIEGDAATKAFAAELENLSTGGQVLLLSALADRGDAAALDVVKKSAESTESSVRLAALQALGKIGGAGEVGFIAERAAKAEGVEKEVATASLVMLQGDAINGGMIELLAESDAGAKAVLIQVLGERKATEAKGAIIEMAKTGDRDVKIAAYKVLRDMGDEGDMAAMVELLANAKANERDQASAMVVATANRFADKSKNADAVIAQIGNVTDVEARGALIEVLGQIGNPNGLAVLREAVSSKDNAVVASAIRGLSSWPNGAALEDLRQAAKSGDNRTHQILALRGYITMIGLSTVSASDKVAMYEEAISLSSRPNEKSQALSGLAQVPTKQAMDTAMKYMEDASLKNEAAAAAVQIADSLIGLPETKDALAVIIENVKNEAIAERAKAVLSKIDEFSSYVMSWQAAGPFSKEGMDAKAMFDEPFAPETDAASVKWETVSAPGTGDVPFKVNFRSYEWLNLDRSIAYARTKVWSDKDQTVLTELGSDDGAKVWMNGEVVHANNTLRGYSVGSDKFKVNLKQGWNDMLIKVSQDTAGWEFSVRFRTEDGSSNVEGLKYSLDY